MNTITFEQLNDTQKQDIANAMLSDHPTRLENTLVEYVLAKSVEDPEAPFSYDDITNNEPYGNIELYTMGGCSSWYELEESDRDEKIEHYEHLRDRADYVVGRLEELQQNIATDNDQDYDKIYYELQTKLDHWEKIRNNMQENVDNLENMDFEEYPEIYQWFACSDWLIRELNNHGQCTLDNTYWGRCSYGQSITLDNVIQRIAFEWFAPYNKSYIEEGSKGWSIIHGVGC